MEEPQHCPRIAARRLGEVVYPERHFLGMEIVWSEFSAVGSRQAYVSLPTCILSCGLMVFPTRSGRREERPLVRYSSLSVL